MPATHASFFTLFAAVVFSFFFSSAQAQTPAHPPQPLFRVPPDGEWHGLFAVNGSLISGNTSSRSIGVSSDIARATEHDRIGLYGSLLRATSRAAGTTTNTGDQQLGGIRYDLNITLDVFAFVNPEWARNKLTGVQLRQSYNGGVGYRLIRGIDVKMDAIVGGGYTRTHYFNAPTSEVGELLIGQEVTYDAGRGITFKERGVVYPAISNDSGLRATLDAAIIAAINQSWAINISATYRYNGGAPSGTRKSELLTLAGLAFRF